MKTNLKATHAVKTNLKATHAMKTNLKATHTTKNLVKATRTRHETIDGDTRNENKLEGDKRLGKCIFSRLGMHARFECLYGCVGIYHGSYYFGSVRNYLLSGIRCFSQVQDHSTASLASFSVNVNVMDKTGSDPPLSNINPEESSQESGLSGEETLRLISRLLDTKLDKKFSEFNGGPFEQKELETSTIIKKMKTEAKASSSFQFKGNKLQFEFNSSLLDSINSASNHLLEGNLAGVNTELENAKTLLNKRNKVIRFADKSPAGRTAVEEYESDELADDSEDEKKLRSAALAKLRTRKQNRGTAQNREFPQEASVVAGSSLHRSVSQPFRPQQFPQQPFRPQRFRSRQSQPSDKCFACGQFGHWANSPFCPNNGRLYSN